MLVVTLPATPVSVFTGNGSLMLEVDKVLSQSCEQSHKNRMLVELSEMESKDGLKISKKPGNVSKYAFFKGIATLQQ